MLTALLLVASFAVGPTPAIAVSGSAPIRPEGVSQVVSTEDLGFAGWLASEGDLPTGTAAASPAVAPAVTCTSCTTCAAMHRSCCFSSASQCNYCVAYGLKCT
jgi:hypothetical protein